MDTFPPPTLAWRTDSAGARFVGTQTIKPGKALRLTGEGYPTPAPREFTVVRWLQPLLRAWCRHRGEQPFVEVAKAMALPMPNPYLRAAAVQSEPLILPNPGLRIRRSYSFRDEEQHFSNLLRVSSFGTLTLNGPGLGVHGVNLVGISGTLTVAVDPPVSVRPLVPWDGPNGGSLRDYVQELAADVAEGTGADASSLGEELWSLLQAAELVPSEPPAGWQVSVTTPIIEAQAGQAVPVEVSILAPTAGAAALALEAADLAGAGTAASEIVVVRWNPTLGEGVIEFAAEPFLL
jgi:hypothetical protein